MDHKRIKLKEGINLTVITDKKFKTDTTSISFICGQGDAAAVCSSLLTGVLSRCCVKYPSLMEINRTLDGLYDAQLISDSFRRGYNHIPTFTVSSLNNRYSLDKTDIRGGCLDVLYNIIFKPELNDGLFDKKLLQSEKQQLNDAVNGIRNTKSSYALRRCTEAMMANQPQYAPKFGKEGSSDNITAEDLTSFYFDMLNNAAVEIVSVSCDDDKYIYEFASKISDSLTERAPAAITEAEYITPGNRIKRLSEEAAVAQDVLCIGCSYDGSLLDGRSAERALFHEIFYQNPTSRLFENVREKLSLCYYCSAMPMTDLKKMILYAGVDSKNAKKAEEEILKQLDLIKRGVEGDELKRCKLAIKNDLLSVTDSPSRTSAWYIKHALYGDDSFDINGFCSKLDRLTSDDVEHAASSVLPGLVFTMKGTDNDET